MIEDYYDILDLETKTYSKKQFPSNMGDKDKWNLNMIIARKTYLMKLLEEKCGPISYDPILIEMAELHFEYMYDEYERIEAELLRRADMFVEKKKKIGLD